MPRKRYQSQCRDCSYIWYPREKKEECPKCKSADVSHYRGFGRLVLIVLCIGAVGGAAYYLLFERSAGEEGDSALPKEERRAEVPEKVVAEAQSDDSPAVPAEQAETSEEARSSRDPAALTGLRTWTARDGRTLEASLLRISLVDGFYVGVFEKAGGETFEYKIGNLSRSDVELVKEIVGKK